MSARTVSNVVNGSARVSEQTRQRVQEAIDELGYRPNLAARSLRDVGLHRATDVVGGVEAWLAAGLPLGDGPADVRR